MSATEAVPMSAKPPVRPDNPIRVLLVEDNEADYWHARDLLDAAPHARFTIDWARDLQSGLARLGPAAFDVCLLEQTLPDGDGLEIVRAAPSRGCDAPIIMLTGHGSLDLDLDAMQLGAADYLDKSRIDATLLERTIRFALCRRQQAQRLSRLAQHDELTGLANRSLLNDRLERALAWARRHERVAAVMVLDLNGFKTVNDRLGHVAGDRLLAMMGMRLSSRLRETDTVARLGGDEFAMVVENLAKPEHAGLVARKLLDAVVAPTAIDGQDVQVTASLGVALYPQDGSHGATLLREADRAMYRAKAEGGNLCRFSSDQIEQRIQRGALLESDLRHALEQGQLVLHYQPQINLADAGMGAEIGIAGLLRWDHPELGLIGAERFMPLAENSSMLEALTDWMLGAACAQGCAWQAMGFHQLHLAVPLLSRRQLAWSGLAQRLEDRVQAAGLDPRRLEIELGEEVLLSEPATGLRALKELGVRVALDGFGRGPTSLRSLQLGVLDTLKLAREWHHQPSADAALADARHGRRPRRAGTDRQVVNIGHSAVVGAIITLARELGLRVVAEAVDDPTQLAFLRRRGCSAVQGLMTDAPLPALACTSWLRKATRRRAVLTSSSGPSSSASAATSRGAGRRPG
jgi:diguanylate cyclase (GGDEF)-like protein